MRFGKQEIITMALIGTCLIVVGIYAFQKKEFNDQQNSDAGKALLGTKEIVTKYTDLFGDPISLEAYNGKARVVNSWATWCPYCLTELPDFDDLAAEYDSDKVIFIAVNRGERKEKARSFIDRVGAGDNLVHVLNPNDSFYDVVGGASMPETVFYDADGSIVYHHRGVMSKEEMKKRTDALLQKNDE